MEIWEFTTNSKEEVDEIISHCEALIELGIEQNEYMMRELYTEQRKRLEKAY